MDNFDMYMPVRLVTGRGCVRKNADRFAALGKRCLIVTSRSAARKSGALADVTAALDSQGIAHTLWDQVKQNPLLLDSVEAGVSAREFGAEFVIGIGGGSALDAAKGTAIFAANETMDPLDAYACRWQHAPLPLALVGTTAGTGSEVAPYAVLTRPDGRKQSVSSEEIYARVSFGDAAYTDSLPWTFTVSTALDALSHALEAYFSTAANALSDLYAMQAARILRKELTGLQTLQEDAARIAPAVRDQLYYASVLAGFALAKCGTCYCHSLGYVLSEEHGVPHGMACAALLPDFLQRAGRLVPDKAEALYAWTGGTEKELVGLIAAMTELPSITLPAGEIEAIASRYSSSANFKRTAPAGYTRAEAVALLTELFGGQ